MRLLVSVRDAREARIAMRHGADVIDAKEPARGALGAPDVHVVRDIREMIGADRTLSAVIGDSLDVRRAHAGARMAALCRCDVVKLGVAGVARTRDARAIVRAAVEGAGSARVALVAYADAASARTLSPGVLLDVAVESGAAGFVIDTFAKRAGSLFHWLAVDDVRALVTRAAASGLFTGIAGGLGGGDVEAVRRTGADLLGVRGAACDGGRAGSISGPRVRELAAACMPLRRPA